MSSFLSQFQHRETEIKSLMQSNIKVYPRALLVLIYRTWPFKKSRFACKKGLKFGGGNRYITNFLSGRLVAFGLTILRANNSYKVKSELFGRCLFRVTMTHLILKPVLKIEVGLFTKYVLQWLSIC